MQNICIELSDYKIYQFEDRSYNYPHIVVEFGDKYLCAEQVERVEGQNILAVWIFPEDLKGKNIHTDHPTELKIKLEKETVENCNKLLLTEIGECIVNDFIAMECLKDYADETVSCAELFLKQEFNDRPGIWTMSQEEFIQYRHSLKADFNAGKLTKEEYIKKVSLSYYANRDYYVLQMKAGISLSGWFEGMTGAKMPHYFSKLIYKYILKNKKNAGLWKYIVENDVYIKPTKTPETRKIHI